VCAIAVIELFEAVLGAKPGHSNPDALRLCALIWELSGGPTMPGQQGDDNNDSAWGRHLREAPKGDKPALVEIRGLLSGIFRENGLVRKGQSGN
jgi:hypothetical protein